MKRKLLFLLFSLISNQVLANYDLSPVRVSESRNSFMLTSVLEHLKVYITDESQQRKLIEHMKTINDNLKHITYDDFSLFVDTQLTTAIINSKSVSKSFEVAGNQIITLQEKLKDKEAQYSEFSRFLIERLLKDYRPYYVNRLLYNYKNPKYRIADNRAQIKQINLLNKYLGEKVNLAATSTSEEFNSFIAKSLYEVMTDLAISSYAFAGAKSKENEVNNPIFVNLANISRTEAPVTEEADPTPAEAMEEISTEPDPSDKIDELIEDVSPNKN